MLAQSFMSAADLGLSEKQRSALIKTLVLMETGEMRHVPSTGLAYIRPQDGVYSGHFNMFSSYAKADCGTVACIRGTAEMVGRIEIPVFDLPDELYKLFYEWGPCGTEDPSVEQAAMALRSYLTMGEARWDLAVTSKEW